MGLERLAAGPAGRMITKAAAEHPAPLLARMRGTVAGLAAGAANHAAGKLHLSFAGGGELIPVGNAHSTQAAMLLRRRLGSAPAVDALTGVRQMHASRPVLHRTTVVVPEGERTLSLVVQARAPGNDFASTTHASSPVSVHVNGRYHSDLFVLGERTSPYEVNLAGLEPGTHVVELRDARDLVAGGGAPILLDDVRSRVLDGVDALVARHAPVIETRWSPRFAATGIADQAINDVPLVQIAVVEPARGGLTRIRSHVLFSNEEASGYPFQQRWRSFGRTSDFELASETWLDGAGRVVGESFQGPIHARYGLGAATERIGARPVLRVATRNGLFSSQAYGLTPRWSETPARVYASLPTDHDVMLEHPWTFAAMGKEHIREGHVVVRGTRPASRAQSVDAREHLYFTPSDGARRALEGARHVTAVLDDGTRRVFTVPRRDWRPAPKGVGARTTAIALPHDLPSTRIAALELPAGRVFALDDAFQPRTIATTG